QLFGLIRELLEFDRVRSEEINLEIKSIDLHSCLAQAIYLQLPSLQEKSLNLVRKYSQKTIKVKADPKKLKQVFINLLGNAIKFTDRGTITISTKIEATDTKNSPKTPFAVVAIQDTGVGIDPKMRSQMFEAFMMEDGSATRSYGGSGLGLTIAQKFMKLMGGFVTLKSPGKDRGTRVEVAIPLAAETVSDVAPVATPSEQTSEIVVREPC
ncbi:MAG: ATP-binding protein, partial [Cyanobacteriota bacterium]|nr:ATP-binding protein [Cyanobacteriota bacterium]